MRRERRAVCALAVFAGLAFGCASRNPPPNPTPAPPPSPAVTPPPSAAAASGRSPEEVLLALEDRRFFDAAVFETAPRLADARVRARAALALGRIGDERAAPLLSRMLEDASAEVRIAAAFGAGILGEPALTPPLTRLLSDLFPTVAAQAAWSLGALEQPSGAAALIAAVRAAPAERRADLLRPLWRFATPAAAAAALPFAADPDSRMRAAALFALARRPQAQSLAALTAGLGDADADTAALCARALGLLGRPESIEPLWAAASGSRAPVTIAALLALEALIEKNPGAALPADAAPRLLALSGDPNPNLAVPALGLMRGLAADRDVFRRLWSVASSGRGRRQQAALTSAMAALGERSRDLADAAMASSDPFLRGTVAESLGFLPAADAAVRRAKLSADSEVFVRLKVLEGLRSPEEVASSRALVDAAFDDPDPGVQAAAVDALARLTDPGILPLIEAAVVRSYGSPAPDVAIEAIAAAETRAPAPAARAVVEAAYRHPSVLVSRLARRALVKGFRADPAAFPWRTYEPKAPEEYARAAAAEREALTARVETERGAFTMRLASLEAPLTVQNFRGLAGRGFFDGVRIHRVAPGFVVQDGDPTGTGNGGPGYEIRDELNPLPYEAGTVGMALAGPDTGGSQWFVTQAPQPHLDGAYTVFGRVIAGRDVVGRIEQGDRILRVTVAPERAP